MQILYLHCQNETHFFNFKFNTFLSEYFHNGNFWCHFLLNNRIPLKQKMVNNELESEDEENKSCCSCCEYSSSTIFVFLLYSLYFIFSFVFWYLSDVALLNLTFYPQIYQFMLFSQFLQFSQTLVIHSQCFSLHIPWFSASSTHSRIQQ